MSDREHRRAREIDRQRKRENKRETEQRVR